MIDVKTFIFFKFPSCIIQKGKRMELLKNTVYVELVKYCTHFISRCLELIRTLVRHVLEKNLD